MNKDTGTIDMVQAVKVGYVFNLFDKKELQGIDLVKTGTKVKVDGKKYPLYAETYQDSAVVDCLLDIHGEKSIDEYRLIEKER